MNERIPDEIRERIAELSRNGGTDAAIAETYQVNPSTVKRIRLSLGVVKGVRYALVKPTPEQLSDLREMSDRAMHKKYNISATAWRRIREQEGIPRHRAPTTGVDAPPRLAQPIRKFTVAKLPTITQPTREYSVATEAADYLRRDRWIVVNREKVYGGRGWDVGRMHLDEEGLIEMATRKGFKREAWMKC